MSLLQPRPGPAYLVVGGHMHGQTMNQEVLPGGWIVLCRPEWLGWPEEYRLRQFMMIDPADSLHGHARTGWLLVLDSLTDEAAYSELLRLFPSYPPGTALWNWLGAHGQDRAMPRAAAYAHAGPEPGGDGWRERADRAIREADAALAAHDGDQYWADAATWHPDLEDEPAQ